MPTQGQIIEAEFVAEKPFDSSDPEQVNEARKKAGRRKKKTATVIEALMTHADCREWMYKLLVTCDVYRLSYMSNESHADMAFREGKRFIGLQLLADIRKAAPDNYELMLRECAEKKLAPLFPETGLD